MNRRQALALLATPAALPLFLKTATGQTGGPPSRDEVLRDPDIPSVGNDKGDVTIVEFFDYQCGYCKTIAPVLADVVKQDGNIRLILKDWPIFGELSVQAARLVLAAKFQNKYHDAHYALMAGKGKLTETRLIETLKDSGVDLQKVQASLDTHDEALKGLLKRNTSQARAFGFPGTPSFIVGTFRVPGVPTADQFKMMVADVRAGKDKSR